MPAERFYIDNPSLEVQGHISLEDEEFHHLKNVMRVKEGESIELVNGKGALAKAKVIKIEKKNALLEILSSTQVEPPLYRLVLAQALPRLPKLELIIEKAVELGATEIWLFPGTLSEKKELSPSQKARVSHICISAMKQCGRLYLPVVKYLPPILSWKKECLPGSSFFGDTAPSAPLFLKSLKDLKQKSALMAIGPEKGFHEKETLYMHKELELQGVKIHENILRTETAAIHSISLLSTFLL